MTSVQLQTVSAYATAFAAVVTTGALVATLVSFNRESRERRRSDVKGVRAWLEWEVSEQSKRAKIAIEKMKKKGMETSESVETLRPILFAENKSDEFIYDVIMTIRPAKVGGYLTAVQSSLRPNQEYRLETFQEVESKKVKFAPPGKEPSIEMLFTDSKGYRWNRTSRGKLVRIYPVRWFTPWRVPHELDLDTLPRWAVWGHWKYRWRLFEWRESFGYPPPFWAVDIRWRRWRWTRENIHVPISWWNLRQKFVMRHKIFNDRVRNHASRPWFAIDDTIREWIWFVGEKRYQRKKEAELDKLIAETEYEY